MIFRYENAHSEFPIQEGEVWKYGDSAISVLDITESALDCFGDADMIYADAPWGLRNVNFFYNQVKKKRLNNFSDFYNKLFGVVKNVNAEVCYLEIGNEYLHVYTENMRRLYNAVQKWPIKYYGKRDCWLVRGGQDITPFDFTGFDDSKTPSHAVKIENPQCVLDPCCGKGITGIAALESGARFIGTEINKRKLALFIKRAAAMGRVFKNG